MHVCARLCAAACVPMLWRRREDNSMRRGVHHILRIARRLLRVCPTHTIDTYYTAVVRQDTLDCAGTAVRLSWLAELKAGAEGAGVREPRRDADDGGFAAAGVLALPLDLLGKGGAAQG